jgi:hypothetical protein
MCNFSMIDVYLTACGVGITAALISLGIAIALNNGFFSAPGSPVAMIAAGIATGVALGSIYLARGAFEEYLSCMELSHRGISALCESSISNFMNAIAALATILGIQTTACFAAAGIAWIPWAGQAPMWVILATLILQIPIITTLGIFFVDVKNCLERASISISISPLFVASLTLTALTLGWFVNKVFVTNRKGKNEY